MQIMTLVPAAPGGLLSLVVQHMPHKLRDRHTQCMFLSAVYAVAESPAGRPIRDSLLAACVEHLLTIDVDIKWEDIVDVPTGEARPGDAHHSPSLSLPQLYFKARGGMHVWIY